MRPRILGILLVLLLASSFQAGSAFDPDPLDNKHETVEPYPVLRDGIKLQFGQIDKQYLGRKCSVYFKKGQPESMSVIGVEPEKMMVWENGIMIENGELAGLSKHGIDVIWYFAKLGAHGGSIAENEIDYIMVEKK